MSGTRAGIYLFGGGKAKRLGLEDFGITFAGNWLGTEPRAQHPLLSDKLRTFLMTGTNLATVQGALSGSTADLFDEWWAF